VNNSAAVARVKVSADGHGVVSHAGWGACRRWRGRLCSQRRSRPHWRTRIGPVDLCTGCGVRRSGRRGRRRGGLRASTSAPLFPSIP